MANEEAVEGWCVQWNGVTSLTDNDEDPCSGREQRPGSFLSERSKVESSL